MKIKLCDDAGHTVWWGKMDFYRCRLCRGAGQRRPTRKPKYRSETPRRVAVCARCHGSGIDPRLLTHIYDGFVMHEAKRELKEATR